MNFHISGIPETWKVTAGHAHPLVGSLKEQQITGLVEPEIFGV